MEMRRSKSTAPVKELVAESQGRHQKTKKKDPYQESRSQLPYHTDKTLLGTSDHKLSVFCSVV